LYGLGPMDNPDEGAAAVREGRVTLAR